MKLIIFYLPEYVNSLLLFLNTSFVLVFNYFVRVYF